VHFPQESISSNAEHFEYDATAALGVKEVSVQQRLQAVIESPLVLTPNLGRGQDREAVPSASSQTPAMQSQPMQTSAGCQNMVNCRKGKCSKEAIENQPSKPRQEPIGENRGYTH
jgi:hypothetical protein